MTADETATVTKLGQNLEDSEPKPKVAKKIGGIEHTLNWLSPCDSHC